MHAVTERYLRRWLKEGLDLLEPKHHDLFARMYAQDTRRDSNWKPHDVHVNTVVDEMEIRRLENAVDQVQRTLRKRGVEKL